MYWNPGADLKRPYAWNILSTVLADDRPRLAATITSVFALVWKEFWGPQTSDLCQNGLEALLATPESTILGLGKMLRNERYREAVVARIKHRDVREYWELDFGGWDARRRAEATAPLKNKLSVFRRQPIKNIVGQAKTTIDIPFFMQRRKMFIVDLSTVTREEARLLGSLIIAALHLSGKRVAHDYYLYVDNANVFTPHILSELLGDSTHHINLTLSSSHTGRLDTSLREAIFGDCGTIAALRCGTDDAKRLHDEFGSLKFKERDFVALQDRRINIKFAGSAEPGTATLYSPQEILKKLAVAEQQQPRGGAHPTDSEETDEGTQEFRGFGRSQNVIQYSRERYGRNRSHVERALSRWERQWDSDEVDLAT